MFPFPVPNVDMATTIGTSHTALGITRSAHVYKDTVEITTIGNIVCIIGPTGADCRFFAFLNRIKKYSTQLQNQELQSTSDCRRTFSSFLVCLSMKIVIRFSEFKMENLFTVISKIRRREPELAYYRESLIRYITTLRVNFNSISYPLSCVETARATIKWSCRHFWAVLFVASFGGLIFAVSISTYIFPLSRRLINCMRNG